LPDDRKLATIARRVSEARRLLDEPLLVEALDKAERQAVEEMLRQPFWAHRRMRMLADRVRVIRDVRRHLELIIVGGEDALKPARRVA
jgi:hypothetical protein